MIPKSHNAKTLRHARRERARAYINSTWDSVEHARRTVKRNPELYARILRLHHSAGHPSINWSVYADMQRIVVAVILPDIDLVWC